MSWPTSPVNGQTTTINGVVYVYNSTKTAWGPASVSSGTTITYTGNVIAGNVYTSGNITFTNMQLNYNSNSVMPKSYVDAIAIVFGF